MTFPKDSAFSEQDAIQERLASKVKDTALPLKPIESAARPVDQGPSLEALNQDLSTALNLLDNGDTSGARDLIEEARNTVYSYLR